MNNIQERRHNVLCYIFKNGRTFGFTEYPTNKITQDKEYLISKGFIVKSERYGYYETTEKGKLAVDNINMIENVTFGTRETKKDNLINLLSKISFERKIKATEYAKEVNLAVSTTRTYIAYLIKAGYAKRRGDMVLTLTEKGEKALEYEEMEEFDD